MSGICDTRLGYHRDSSRGEIKIREDALNPSPVTCRIILGVGGLIATAFIAYWPAWSALWRPHGYLVSLLAMWLLYSASQRLENASARPLPWMLLLLVPCGLAALLLWRSAIPGVQLLMLPPVLLLAVLAAFGPAVARAAAVPIMFLYFAAPLWNFVLTAPLQDLTTRVAAILAPVLGLPATVHGHLVSFPNGITFEVTPACSGAGFLVQGLAIATLLGELEQARLGRRLRLLGSMVLVALVANWVRVLVIIELGYSSGMRSTLATRDHVAFGYFLFVLILAAYLWVASRRPLPPAAEPRVAQAAEPAWRPRIAYALVILVLASTPVLVAALIPLRTPPATVPAAESPRTRAAPADRWQLLAFTAGRSPTDGLS